MNPGQLYGATVSHLRTPIGGNPPSVKKFARNPPLPGYGASSVLNLTAVRDGAKAIIPLGLPGIPFGLVYGLAVSEAANVPNLAGWAASLVIVAGAAQLAAVNLLNDGGAAITVIVTVILINARHVMYSAALSRRFRPLPMWFRIGAPYMMVDQMFAYSDSLGDEIAPDVRVGRYIGAAAFMLTMWMGSTTVGLIIGDAIPASWSLDFAVPLMFLGLLVLGVTNRPGVLAAVVAGLVAVLARDFPNGSGLLTGLVAGVIAGGLADIALERRGAEA